MSEQPDNPDAIHLPQLSSDLRESLQRCRILLNDCKSKLAANSNDSVIVGQGEGNEVPID